MGEDLTLNIICGMALNLILQYLWLINNDCILDKSRTNNVNMSGGEGQDEEYLDFTGPAPGTDGLVKGNFLVCIIICYIPLMLAPTSSK